mgnify:CR=1
MVDDWDKWLDDYEPRNGRNGENSLNNIIESDKINKKSNYRKTKIKNIVEMYCVGR